MDNSELADAIREAYSDFYDDPRAIHYREIEAEYGTDELIETDLIAEAIDLGVRHQENGVEKWDSENALAEVLSWHDPEAA